jgi:hypothetical protein
MITESLQRTESAGARINPHGGTIFPLALLLLVLLLVASRSDAGTTSEGVRTWRYQLLPASYLIEDCPPCAGPTRLEPMRGTFDLRLVSENPLFTCYELTSIAFTAGYIVGRTYNVTGHGTYSVGGEVALRQDMFLELRIDDGNSNRLCYLTNGTPAVNRLWPMIETTLVQTNGTFVQVYNLHLFAAPLREMWFSTANGMTPSIWQPPTNHISGGDLLSSSGHVVKSNRELTQRLGLMPSPDAPDLGLDAVDVLPGGEVAFSIEEDVFSETLGPLQHGDLLSNRGRIIQRNQQLTAAFMQMPPAPDAGLDAAQVIDGGEVYFSIEKNFFSEGLGRTIRAGDLLSSRGTIVKSNEQLVARFQPADPRQDYGLDAFYVWPSGEVWFSVETGFQGQNFESYNRGDLLSDQGYVVYRNLDLVGPFQPLEDLADFGLDALFVVGDSGPPAPAPDFTRIRRQEATGPVELEWRGDGRVWQVLRATNVLGPWLPLSPISPDSTFNDVGAAAVQSFYRLTQW